MAHAGRRREAAILVDWFHPELLVTAAASLMSIVGKVNTPRKLHLDLKKSKMASLENYLSRNEALITMLFPTVK